VVSFKQDKRVINKTVNRYDALVLENGVPRRTRNVQASGDAWAIRKSLHKDTVAGKVKLRLVKEVSFTSAMADWKMIVDSDLKTEIKRLLSGGGDEKTVLKHFKANGMKFGDRDIKKVDIFYWDDELAANRVDLDTSFNSDKISKVTDSGIRKILTAHLKHFDEMKNGTVIEHPEIAFSPEGIDQMNKEIRTLNDGKDHKPIYKVRRFEPLGSKFPIGTEGSRSSKFVEADKGTVLYFAIYSTPDGKRKFESMPFNLIVERLKQGLTPAPMINQDGYPLLFVLSPYDQVSLDNLKESNPNGVYRMVSSSGPQVFFLPNSVSKAIADKVEYLATNKMERSLNGIMVKEACRKMVVDRLGNIRQAHGDELYR